MNDGEGHQRLRQILLVKWLVTVFVWGLPALIGPTALFGILRVPMPDDLTFVRLFGAVVTAVALAYFYAWRDPERNVAILKFGVLDNGLVTLTIVVLALVTGSTSWFLLGSAVLTAFFCVAFLVLMPRPTPR
jgi:hypothetical protein